MDPFRNGAAGVVSPARCQASTFRRTDHPGRGTLRWLRNFQLMPQPPSFSRRGMFARDRSAQNSNCDTTGLFINSEGKGHRQLISPCRAVKIGKNRPSDFLHIVILLIVVWQQNTNVLCDYSHVNLLSLVLGDETSSVTNELSLRRTKFLFEK